MTDKVSSSTLLLRILFTFLVTTNPYLILIFKWAHPHLIHIYKWAKQHQGWLQDADFASVLSFPLSPILAQDPRRIPYRRGLPFFGCIDFFSRRNDFIRECLQIVNDKICEIQLPKVRCLSISIPSIKFKSHFGSAALSLYQAIKVAVLSLITNTLASIVVILSYMAG
jgi:hypothetical protein